MVNICFVLHEEVIDVFHENNYIPTIEKLSFHLVRVRILCSIEFENTRHIYFQNNATKKYRETKK